MTSPVRSLLCWSAIRCASMNQRADARVVASIIKRGDGDGLTAGDHLLVSRWKWWLWCSDSSDGKGFKRSHGCEKTVSTCGDAIHPLPYMIRDQCDALVRELIHHPQRMVHQTVSQ